VALILGGAIVVFVLLLVTVPSLIPRSFYIPAGSMQPTLEIDDHIMVDTSAYGWSRYSLRFGLSGLLPPGKGRLFGRLPRRGDVIVFRHPDPRQRESLVKRVIGLPGDRVQMKSGRLYINGAIVPREPVKQVAYRDYHGEIQTPMLYEETLPGGKRYAIYERSDDGPLDDTIVYTVPEGELFVLGDNRDASADSRVPGMGYVPAENIIGKAVKVLFTLNRCRPEEGLSCPENRTPRGL
jgi:signal peptidase I